MPHTLASALDDNLELLPEARVRLLLVQPGSEWTMLGQTSSKGKAGTVRLSLPIVAALTPKDIEVAFVDCRMQELDYEKHVDLVGITVLTCEAPFAYEIATRFRERKVPVVLGGYHPTFRPQEAGRYADAVVIGEAELVWAELIDDFRHGTLKKFYSADRLCDMDRDVPMPKRDILNAELYHTFNTIQATRGCSLACNFCSVGAFFNHKFRTRSPDLVVAEIRELLSRGKLRRRRNRILAPRERVVFVDDNLIFDTKYALNLFEELVPLKIRWSCQATVKLAEDEHLLALAAQSGCEWVSVGFESINPENLKWLSKNWLPIGHGAGSTQKAGFEDIIEAYRNIVSNFHRHGINVLGNFMLGFDSDTPEMVERTIKATTRTNLDAALFHVVTPFPGTQLGEILDRQRRIMSRDWSLYDSGQVVFAPAQLSPNELQELYWKGYEEFYKVHRILLRGLRRPYSATSTVAIGMSTRRKMKRLNGKNSLRKESQKGFHPHSKKGAN